MFNIGDTLGRSMNCLLEDITCLVGFWFWYQDWFREFLWLFNDVNQFLISSSISTKSFASRRKVKSWRASTISSSDWGIRGGGTNFWCALMHWKRGFIYHVFLDVIGHQKYPKQCTLQCSFGRNSDFIGFLWMFFVRTLAPDDFLTFFSQLGSQETRIPALIN